ncbi:hypothetical protein [Bacillus tropicus]|uniref:hypothetical protein n=1 Tax=Bacillus tropicus TaxID=2026188 RepID=UPI002079BD6F|nr:hypothetical protein [Bacillus tropicus]USK99816.1 hypothetical protein LIS81_27505 [Bacillus tropicus]
MLNLVNFKSQTPTMKFPRIKKLIQFDVDIWLYKNKLPTDQLDLHFKKCTNCSYYVETIELIEKKPYTENHMRIYVAIVIMFYVITCEIQNDISVPSRTAFP